MNRILSAIVVFAAFAFAPLLSNAADTPDATLDISGSRVAFGVGIVQGGGTLHFQGQNYAVHAHGLTVGEVGGGTIMATGEVYNLSNLRCSVGWRRRRHCDAESERRRNQAPCNYTRG